MVSMESEEGRHQTVICRREAGWETDTFRELASFLWPRPTIS